MERSQSQPVPAGPAAVRGDAVERERAPAVVVAGDAGPAADGTEGTETAPPRTARWLDALPYLPVVAIVGLTGFIARSSHLLTRDLTPLQPDVVETYLRVDAATHFHAYTGAYSLYGWQHPGPAYFYLIAPFKVLLGGRIAGLAVGTAVLHLVALVATVIVVHRAWGRVAATATSLALCLWLVRYGPPHLFEMWNPMITSTWTILFLAAAAATISGLNRDRWKGPFVVCLVSGSFLVQAHVGTALLVVAVTALVLVRSARTVRATRRRAVLGATVAVFGILLWAPVVVDQVSGGHNVTALTRYFVFGEELPTTFVFPDGATQRRQPAAKTVPRGAAVLSPRLENIGGLAGTDLIPSAKVRGTPMDGVLIAGLVAANVGLAYSPRVRRRSVAVLARITVVATGASLLSLTMVRGPKFDLYQVHYLTGVRFWLWATPVVFAAGWVADRVRDRPATSPARRRAPVVAAAVVGATVALFVATTNRHLPLFDVDHDSPARVILASDPDLTRVNLRVAPDQQTILMNTILGLDQAGVRVGTDPQWRLIVSDEQRRVFCDAPTVTIRRVTDADLAAGAGSAPEVIGVFTDDGAHYRVAIAPTPC